MNDKFNASMLFDEVRAAVALIANQLPYLLTTGSCENYLRDTLAYQIATRHNNVARDHRVQCNGVWRKADIAVLENEAIRAIVELKQLYLKDFRTRGHAYIKNIVADVTDRRSACDEVYGIILTRHIPPDFALPWGKNFKYAFERADRKHVQAGVERLAKEITDLSCVADCHPKSGTTARVLPQDGESPGVGLFAWVIRAK
jgi:hypothetical protein